MRVKNILKKLLISLLIVLTLLNFMSASNLKPNYSFAAGSEERVNDMMNNNATGIIGTIHKAFMIAPVALASAARSINYYLASSAGTTTGAAQNEVTPFDIFFNRFTLLDANIFSTTDRDGNPLPTDGIVYKIRTNAAIWYYGIRTIAISIIAIMLIWNLIRSISKNTSADQKAVAKNSLTDWVLSFALIMFMHIIVIVVLNFNDAILKGIEAITPFSDTADFFDSLENAIFEPRYALSIAALIVYFLLNWQTFKYILVYIQRLLTIVLLVMISPIIPITYSTDRMKGGKGAALNGWLRELLFNVFVQTLHAIIYAALVGVAMAALTSVSITDVISLGPALIAVASILFIKYAEKMVKTIFGFDSSQVINTNVFANAATTIGNVTSSVRSLVNPAAATARPANGGSMISFGQNISGANTGIGQNAGIGASNPIKGRGASFIGGIFGIATGRNGANGQNGDASANANATATATATANGKDNRATATAENDNATSEVSDVYDAGGASVEENERDDKQDRKQNKSDERLDKLEEMQDQADERPKTPEEMAGEEFAKFIAAYSTKSQSDNNKETNSKETTVEEHETIKEETHEEIETEKIEQVTDETKLDKKSEIPPVVAGDIKPDELNEMKSMIKAAISDSKARLDELRTETKNQLNELKSNLDSKTADEIEKKINSIWAKPEELGKYIKGLPEGSDERKYAELYARFSSLMAIDDNMSKEEKIEIVTTLDKAKGAELSEDFARKVSEDSSQLDNLQAASKSSENRAPIEANVTETKPREGVKEDIKAESRKDVKEETLETEAKVTGVMNLKDEAIKRAQDALLKLGVKAEDELEIQSDFQARYDATASEIGIKEPTMEDIIKSLSPAAQREYRDYTSGKLGLDAVKNTNALNAIALEREADAIRKIQNEARKEGFEMNVEDTEYRGTVTINGRTETFTSNSVGGTITNLSRIREEEERRRAERNKSKLA